MLRRCTSSRRSLHAGTSREAPEHTQRKGRTRKWQKKHKNSSDGGVPTAEHKETPTRNVPQQQAVATTNAQSSTSFRELAVLRPPQVRECCLQHNPPSVHCSEKANAPVGREVNHGSVAARIDGQNMIKKEGASRWFAVGLPHFRALDELNAYSVTNRRASHMTHLARYSVRVRGAPIDAQTSPYGQRKS